MKRKYSKTLLLSAVIAAISLLRAENASAQLLAVKANAAMYAVMTPNLSFEMVTGERTSVDFSIFGHAKPYGKDSRMIGLQPQFKYWFAGRPLVREYVGVMALALAYDSTWKMSLMRAMPQPSVSQPDTCCLLANVGMWNSPAVSEFLPTITGPMTRRPSLQADLKPSDAAL